MKFYEIEPQIIITEEYMSYEKGLYLKIENPEIDKYAIEESFQLVESEGHITIQSTSGKGILYGIFHLIECIIKGTDLNHLSVNAKPEMNYRMLNHWDNCDGSIERGYSGASFYFEDNQLVVNQRTKDYARLMASIAINSIVINNVNVKDEATFLITSQYFNELKSLANFFYAYGIQLFLSINYASPIDIGGLTTADPLDEEVQQWWQQQSTLVFEAIPNFGGYLVKADSEGRPGPYTYSRNQAEGANMLAKSVAPYGGIIIWRSFVYNCMQDWRDVSVDRAKASYDYFKPLDGEFDDNVIVQIKNGPMDFQVREPVSPLLGAMPSTNQCLEVQATQEYTGQQIDVCYLVPMWKKVLEFEVCPEKKKTMATYLKEQGDKRRLSGIVAVTNTGNDANWTGHDLAAANLYGFGKLAWNSKATSKEIALDWCKMTYGNCEKVTSTIVKILMMSWDTYELYTAPLGIGWMVNPSHHYGPNVDGYEYDRWGTYHRADWVAIGVDRTSTGTGFTKQYDRINRDIFDSIDSCPEEMLLFFHRVPYKKILKSGKTLIQHIYERVTLRFRQQHDNAIEWRDCINTYFYRKTGCADESERQIY
jgi:alpha-glucuronidase